MNSPTSFPVGVELSHTDLGDHTYSSSPNSTPSFVRCIMHQAVSARSFECTVQYDASSADIARAVGVPAHQVEHYWLAGVKTPSQLPERPVNTSKNNMRFTPQSLLDSCDIADVNAKSNSVSPSLPSPTPIPVGLEGERYKEMFEKEPEIDKDLLQFGNALIERLEKLVGQPWPRLQPRPKRRNAVSKRTANNSNGSAISSETQTCGFNPENSHADVDIVCRGAGIWKSGTGLYRTAKSFSRMMPSDTKNTKQYYFESVIVDDQDAGGICIGVSTDALQLNKLVGSDQHSCGMHSSGQIVCDNGQFLEYGQQFKSGDRIGCLVELPSQGDSIELTFSVNGKRERTMKRDLWKGLEGAQRYLVASISLYKKDSKVVMQCCEEDWKGDEIDRNTVHSICGSRNKN